MARNGKEVGTFRAKFPRLEMEKSRGGMPGRRGMEKRMGDETLPKRFQLSFPARPSVNKSTEESIRNSFLRFDKRFAR